MTADSFREWLLAAAAVGALITTWQGLATWKQQLQGTADWELARRMLRDVYSVRDAMRAVRSVFVGGAEMEAALELRPAPLSRATNPDDGLIAAYQKRWERVRSVLSDLEVDIVEGEVLWGPGTQRALSPLRDCALDLNFALAAYLEWKMGKPLPPNETARKHVETIVLPIPDDQGKNEFEDRLNDAIRLAEAFVGRHFRR